MNKEAVNYSLGPLERAILKIVWNNDKVCVRHVLDQLADDFNPAYTTIMTIMNRMVDKGILVREKPNNTCYYQTSQSKKDFLSNLIEKKMETIINQYGAEVVPILKQEINHLK